MEEILHKLLDSAKKLEKLEELAQDDNIDELNKMLENYPSLKKKLNGIKHHKDNVSEYDYIQKPRQNSTFCVVCKRQEIVPNTITPVGWVKCCCGTQLHYENGLMNNPTPHRGVDSPALIGSDGSESYWENGKMHRVGLPAVIDKKGNKKYLVHGLYHSLHEPAHKGRYYILGREYTYDEWIKFGRNMYDELTMF